MKIKCTKFASTLITLCFIASPLASGATTTLIGNGVNGGELDVNNVDATLFFPDLSQHVNWDGGTYLDDPTDPGSVYDNNPEFKDGVGLNLAPTIGKQWLDTLADTKSQTINNNTKFNVTANTIMTLSVDFSRWNLFADGTTPGTVVTFSMGSTVLGNITYGMDTNGLGAWNTYTVTNVPVAAGLNQTFSITTVGNTNSIGFAIDNLTLTSDTIPEPSTALMGVVALGFAIGRRRRA